ncbi:MAG: RNA polymerase sigma factor [Planctomycetota bacterium]
MSIIPQNTSLSLLRRLTGTQPDTEAWDLFVARYGPKLLEWARRWHVSEDDSYELVQQVLVGLVEQFRNRRFESTRSFRAWMKTNAYRVWVRLQRQQQRQLRSVPVRDTKLLSVEAREDMLKLIDQQAEAEAMEIAIARVKARVHEKTWEAFKLLALGDMEGKAIAEQLGMSISSVYVARHNVQKMLTEEIEKLSRE